MNFKKYLDSFGLKKNVVLLIALTFMTIASTSCNINTVIEHNNFCKLYTDIVDLNNSGAYGKAINKIEAFENGKDSFIVQYQKAIALLEIGDTTANFKLIYYLLDKYPQKVNLNYILAFQHATLEQYDSALYYCTKAIDLKGGVDLNLQTVAPVNCGINNDDILMEEILYIRGLSYYSLGYINEAKHDFLYCNYRAYNPSYVFQSLADVYGALGQRDSAVFFQKHAEAWQLKIDSI